MTFILNNIMFIGISIAVIIDFRLAYKLLCSDTELHWVEKSDIEILRFVSMGGIIAVSFIIKFLFGEW